LKFFFTCGDEEETLGPTNEELHHLLVELDFSHVYRVGHGGHSWDYWHHELPEALRFIGCTFSNIPYEGDNTKLEGK
jgi:enterochelin esterase-like enzyme